MSDADTGDAIFVCICQHSREHQALQGRGFTPLETGKDCDESSYYYNYTKAIIVIFSSGTDKSKLESFYTMCM